TLEGAGPPPGGPPSANRKIAADAVFDSVSVATPFQKELKAAGVIFMPISEAIREHPELVQKYLGTAVPRYFCTSSGCSRIASEIGMKITPAAFSSFWKGVATETESNTASAAILRLADGGPPGGGPAPSRV
ncbi:hypothetical protein QU41_00025, partial [Bradyrhizobium elkanii]